jgi:hypothetical protein
MHERKAAMAREADAFIALPGNHLGNSHQYSFKRKQTIILSVLFLETVEIFLYKLEIVFLGVLHTHLFHFLMVLGGYGTMEELLEMITWAQLGIHKKPVTY